MENRRAREATPVPGGGDGGYEEVETGVAGVSGVVVAEREVGVVMGFLGLRGV